MFCRVQDDEGRFHCICTDGWAQPNCSEETDECEEGHFCQNGATCMVSHKSKNGFLLISVIPHRMSLTASAVPALLAGVDISVLTMLMSVLPIPVRTEAPAM